MKKITRKQLLIAVVALMAFAAVFETVKPAISSPVTISSSTSGGRR